MIERSRFLIPALCAVVYFIAAIVPANAEAPFPDVPAESWAYGAIKQLVDDGLITGYPDGTFKGDRPLTRYEASYLLSKAIAAIKERIAQGRPAPPPTDVALVNRLSETLAADLEDVSKRVAALEHETAALEKKTDAVEKQAAASAGLLRGFDIKLNYFARPGTFSQNVVAVNGPTALAKGTIAPGATLPGGAGPAPLGSGFFGPTSQGTSLGQNALNSGDYQHGVAFQVTRLVFSGEPSPNFTYYVRLENRYQFSSPNYQSISSPAYCMSTTAATIAGVNACQSQDFAGGNTPVRLNQSWFQYRAPSGMFVKMGRWQEDEGNASSLGLAMGGNYVNGVQVGYRGKRLQTFGAYAFGDTALTNAALNNSGCPVGASPCAGTSQQVLLGMLSYDVTKRTNVGFTYDNYIGSAYALWNPAAGLCAPTATAPAGTASATTLNARVACPSGTALIATAAGPVTGAYQTATTGLVTGSASVTQFIGEKAKVTLEYLHRFGNDPFTGAGWVGANAYGAQVDFATKGLTRPGPLFPGYGKKDSTVYEAAWVTAGFNGLSPDAGPAGTTPYQAFFFNSLNGFQWSWLTVQHWWSPSVRTGLVYEHFQTNPNQFQPAGSVTCPGCYLRSVNANALFFETYLNM